MHIRYIDSNCDVLSGLLELFLKDRFMSICKYHEFANIEIIILMLFFHRKTCKTTIFPQSLKGWKGKR